MITKGPVVAPLLVTDPAQPSAQLCVHVRHVPDLTEARVARQSQIKLSIAQDACTAPGKDRNSVPGTWEGQKLGT